MPPPSPETPPLWSLIGEFAAAAVTVFAAAWALTVTVFRPLFEALVFRALRARKAELTEFLRLEVLKGDLDTTQATAKSVDRLLFLAKQNTESIQEMVERHNILDRELRTLPALAQSLETCTHAVETLSRDVGLLSGRIERYGGMIEQQQREKGRV